MCTRMYAFKGNKEEEEEEEGMTVVVHINSAMKKHSADSEFREEMLSAL